MNLPPPVSPILPLLTMTMNMCIVMYMNIYIRPDLEEHLRKEDSMSGLINSLLHDYYDKKDYNIQRPVVEPSATKPAKQELSSALPEEDTTLTSNTTISAFKTCPHGDDPKECVQVSCVTARRMGNGA